MVMRVALASVVVIIHEYKVMICEPYQRIQLIYKTPLLVNM